jgi:hypothetical protein
VGIPPSWHDRRTKERNTGGYRSRERDRSSPEITVSSHSRCADGPYVSLSEMPSSCEPGREDAGAHRVLLTGSYAVRGRLPGSGRPLVLNVALWVSRDDLLRGVHPCTACNERPRRIDGNYCGSSCERRDAQRQQQPQWHQQYYPPPGTPPGNVTRGIAAGESFPTNSPEANKYLSLGHPPVESTWSIVPPDLCVQHSRLTAESSFNSRTCTLREVRFEVFGVGQEPASV